MSTALASRKSRALLLLWITEVALLMLAVLAAAWLRFLGNAAGLAIFMDELAERAVIFAMVITIAMVAFGLYQVHVRHNRMEFMVRLVLSFAFGGIALLVMYYLVPATYIGRGVLAIALVTGFLVIGGVRLLVGRVIKTDVFRRRVLVLGAGTNADLINSRMRRRADRQSFVIVGFLPIPDQPVVVPEHMLLNTDFARS